MFTNCLRRSLVNYLQQRPVRLYSSSHAYTLPKKGDKVIIAMSGGVDSSVAARLLAEQEYDLSAVYMRNWDTRDESGSDQGCEWKTDWNYVQRICQQLDIPCEMVDLSREYWLRVFEPSLRQWEDGVTPNPDVWCNKEIKFGALLDYIPSLRDSRVWLATGHYARKQISSDTFGSEPPRPQLFRATDKTKDQTYFLASISEKALSRALFPLGHLHKTEVRELANQYNLPTAERQESMGLCFVGQKGHFRDFLSSYIPPKPGPIIDLTTGAKIHEHSGLWNYTIGQGARIPGLKEKTFVVRKDVEKNTIYIVSGRDNPLLRTRRIHVDKFSFIWTDTPPKEVYDASGYRAFVKVLHKMQPAQCTVFGSRGTDSVTIDFDEPLVGIAPGQVAVLYDTEGEWCLGCGAITDSIPLETQDVDCGP